ncbi:MAG TPA: hypothetical protein GXZ90_03425 [Clostridiales bacterium]|nr:hypothetical protein [Clostridiales bacterium]
MKKKIMILAFIAICLSSSKVFASSPGREIKNILDLTNFKMDFETGLYSTKVPIEVLVDEQYTIVADKDFIGHNDDVSFELVYENSEKEIIQMSYVTNTEVIVVFEPKESPIHINNFNFTGVGGTNLMMYLGDDNDYEHKFIPYTTKDNYMRGRLEIDYDHPLTVEQIDNYVKAYNPSNNTELNVIRSRNTYKHAIGSYEALYYALLNNTNNVFYLEIEVVDKTAPVINTNELVYGFTEMPTIDKILKDIKVTDNVDNITLEEIEVLSTNYDISEGVGSYVVNVEVTDKSNNASQKEISVLIKDNIAPEIKGPSALFVYTTQMSLTEEMILSNYLISDDNTTAEDISITITNEYNETKEVGKYNVFIKAIDSTGNETTKKIIIHVINNNQAEYIIDPVITTSPEVLLTEDQILNIFMEEVNKLGIDVSEVRLNKDIYDLNYNNEGEYKTYVEYLLNGEAKYAEVTILVKSEETSNNKYIFIAAAFIAVGLSVIIIKRKNKKAIDTR